MSDSTIRRSSRPQMSPEQRKRRRSIQISSGIIAIVLCIFVGFWAQGKYPGGNSAFIWAIGLSLGYVLQRSRFCFTAAVRDPVLTGGTDLTKALVVALALSSLLYAGLHIKAIGWNLQGEGKLVGNIANVGIHTLIGGFIFGIGAVISGGCASGTLMRMGEGFVQQWIAIVFFIIGSVLGGPILNLVRKSNFLHPGKSIHLAKLFGGWLPALIVQFGLLFAIYILADWYGKKRSGELS